MTAMRVMLLEDEPHAAAHLQALLRTCDPDIDITATAESVTESIRLLKLMRPPDLVLADIRLNDGLSLRVFAVSCPVVFVTAYDQYLLRAFELSAIDYLLKPVEQERLAQALEKYRRLGSHFGARLSDLARTLSTPGFRQRVVVRHGADQQALPVERIAWITTEHRLTLVIDRDGRRLLSDESLADLETQLDPQRFFRLNRQHLVQVDSVKSWRASGKGRISVELHPPSEHDVIISQENGAAFRDWMAR